MSVVSLLAHTLPTPFAFVTISEFINLFTLQTSVKNAIAPEHDGFLIFCSEETIIKYVEHWDRGATSADI